MPGIGGSLESMTIDGRYFAVAADSQVQRKIGGDENEVLANGDGSARLVKTVIPWGWDGAALVIDDDNGDHEFLVAIAKRNAFVIITGTYPSGVTYSGQGQIVGEVQYDNQAATASVNFMGAGELTQL